MPVFDLENIIGKLALEKAGEKFLNALEDEAAETFLEMLLLFMKLKFTFDPSYRRNSAVFETKTLIFPMTTLLLGSGIGLNPSFS